MEPGGTEIDGRTLELLGPDPAADSLSCLQHDHLAASGNQLLSTGQPRKTCPDHDRVDRLAWLRSKG